MAEIPVEKKSSMGWLWIVLALIAAALLLWWLFADGDDERDTDTEAVAIEESVGTADTDNRAAADGEMTIAAILANPSAFYGREGFTGEVTVGGPLTDRGFWIEHEGNRMFALVVDQPAEVPLDINTGATLRLNGGTVREASTISADEIVGDALDQDTMNVLQGQEAVLVIEEDNIEITQET